jgi:hypothetical protein
MKWPGENWRNPVSRCIADAVGAMSLSYDYAVLPASEANGRENEWIVQFDPIGGYDGYKDPYVVLKASQQQVLMVNVRQHAQDKTLEIMEAKLVARERQPDHVPGEPTRLSWHAIREKILRFFGQESEEGKRPGHVVYLRYEWDEYGKTGTLNHLLRNTWADVQEWQWLLISIICGSIFAGLLLFYGMFKLVIFIRRDYAERVTRFTRDEEGTFHERGRLINLDDEEETLIDLEDEDERSALLVGGETARSALKVVDVKEQTPAALTSSNDKPLFDKPLPPLPPNEED